MLDMATITIGGNDYILRFPLAQMLKAEKVLGKPLQKVFMVQKDATGAIIPAEYNLTDLVVLFKYGMQAEHSNLSSEQVEELLVNFLQDGPTMAVQITILFSTLGKALGFFRTEVDFQKKMGEILESKKTK